VEHLKRAWAEDLADMIAADDGLNLDRMSPSARQDRLEQARYYVDVLSSTIYLDLHYEITNRDDYISLLLAERKQNAH